MKKLTVEQKLRKMIREEYRRLYTESNWSESSIESLFDLLGQEDWTEVIPNKSGYTTGKKYGQIHYLITPQYLSLTFDSANLASNACATLQKKYSCSVFSNNKPETLIVR